MTNLNYEGPFSDESCELIVRSIERIYELRNSILKCHSVLSFMKDFKFLDYMGEVEQKWRGGEKIENEEVKL